MKICKNCQLEKPLSDFHNCRTNPDGKQYRCKVCSLAENAAWHVRNRDKRAAYSADRHKANPERQRVRDAASRLNVKTRARNLVTAAKLRMPEGFSLSIDRIAGRIGHGFCAVTGLPFDLRPFELTRSGKRCNPFAPSIDRIDSTKGYTNENTRVVIWQFNHMKGELTDAELLSVCKHIVSRLA